MDEHQGERFRCCRRCARPRKGHRFDRGQWHCPNPGGREVFEPDQSLESNVRIETEILIAATRKGFYWPTLPSGLRDIRAAMHRLYRSVVEDEPHESSLLDAFRKP